MPYKFNPFTANFDEIPSAKMEKSVYSTVSAASADWNSVYSTVNAKSATEWDNELSRLYTHTNFLPLSGGNVNGELSVSDNVYVGPIKFTNEIINESSVENITTTNMFLKVVLNNTTVKYIRLYDIDSFDLFVDEFNNEIVDEFDNNLVF